MLFKDKSFYTFSQIFELNMETDEVLAAFGYDYQITSLDLPQQQSSLQPLFQQMQQQMRDRLPQVPLNTEAARREFYISPVLFAVLDQVKFKMSIEYPVTTERLRGALDYLLRGGQNVVIVEAERADMERGFTQLAAEMIALVEAQPLLSKAIYGAVTTGNLWQFGVLDQEAQQVTKGLEEYLLPRDLVTVFNILLGLLGG